MPDHALPPGSPIAGPYTTLRLLRVLEDAFVYAVNDSQVQVTEFFPRGAQRQDGQVTPPGDIDLPLWSRVKREYLQLARSLAGLRHPSLSRVNDVREEAGTVYLVTSDGAPHSLASATQAAGALPAGQVEALLEALTQALGRAHEAGLQHLAISPEAIMLRDDGVPVLTHFGFAGQVCRAHLGGDPPPSSPFTPLEQQGGGRLGSYTDIYALCASLYAALHGEPPLTASQRALGASLPLNPPDTSYGLSQALSRGLAVGLGERALSARELLETLKTPKRAVVGAPVAGPDESPPPLPSPTPAPVPLPQAPPAARPAPPARRFMAPLAVTLGVALAAGWLGLRTLASSGSGAAPAPEATVAASSPPAAETQPVIPAEAVSDVPPAPAPETPPAQVMTLFVNQDGLGVRSAPEEGASTVATLARGTLVQAGAARGGWFQVEAGGQSGWVNATSVLPVLDDQDVQGLLDAVTQGGDVSLKRGAYRLATPLDLNADVTLVGQGMNQTVLFSEAPADTVVAHQWQVELRDLTVVHVGGAFARTLVADGTTLTLTNVRLSGAKRDDSQAEFGSGLWAQNGATATLEGSELSGNAFGLYVSDTAQVQASTSQFNHNTSNGAYFKDSASGTITDSSLDFNTVHGLAVAGSASPIVTKSHLRHNGQRGATLYGQSSATLTDDLIEANGYQGIGVQDDATPSLSGNTIQANVESGITYFGSSAGSAENNLVQRNLKSGVSVTQSASPTLSGNTVVGNRENGLSFSDQSQATATGNHIRLNGNPGIAAWGDARLTASENVVERNKQSGIVLAERTTGELSGNTSQDNAYYGLIVTGQAAPVVSGNTVSGNGRGGIFYKEGAGGTLESNTCSGNGGQDISSALDQANSGPDVVGESCSAQTQ